MSTPNKDTSPPQRDADVNCNLRPLSGGASNEGNIYITRLTEKWGNTTKNVAPTTPYFKGNVAELSGKVFISKPHQASKYDDTYKFLLSYFGTTYDQCVHQAFEQKDSTVGLVLLTKPITPKNSVTTVTIDHDDLNKTITNVELKVDKNSEDFFEYQIELKKYIDNK